MGIGIAFCLAIAALAGLVAWRVAVRMRARRDAMRLEEQLAQAELQIAECSRSGLPVGQAILSTFEGSDEPLRSLFESVYNEVEYGGATLADAMARMAERAGSKDAELLAASVAVQQESGSSLAEAMEFLSETVSRRIEMRQTLRSRLAESRVTIAVVAVAPPALFAFCCLALPGFAEFYATEPLGWAVVAAAVLMELLGLAVLWRMADMRME